MKKCILFLILCLLSICVCACSENNEETTEVVDLGDNCIYRYYIDTETNSLLADVYELDPEETDSARIANILNLMFEQPTQDQTASWASAMKLLSCEYQEDLNRVRISVNITSGLSDNYYEVLMKAAVTKTLCQLPYVDNVQFEIFDSTAAVSEGGSLVETYNENSFVDANEEGGYLQKEVITLYFANEAGDRLVEYDKAVEITNNVSVEQLVIDSLIAGPLREGYIGTIPEGTTIKKISVKDGVCYVDFSSEFNNTLSSCLDVVTIYSVVNSLCELPTITKVQFLINGEKQAFYREEIPFDGMFEYQPDIVEMDEDEAQSRYDAGRSYM